MIASKNKINSREFKKFYNSGKNYNGKYLRISFIENSKDIFNQSKYAVIVGKKISKKAVIRNRNKRKLFNIIKEIYPQFSHLKFVFIFLNKDVLNIEYKKVKDEIIYLLSK